MREIGEGTYLSRNKGGESLPLSTYPVKVHIKELIQSYNFVLQILGCNLTTFYGTILQYSFIRVEFWYSEVYWVSQTKKNRKRKKKIAIPHFLGRRQHAIPSEEREKRCGELVTGYPPLPRQICDGGKPLTAALKICVVLCATSFYRTFASSSDQQWSTKLLVLVLMLPPLDLVRGKDIFNESFLGALFVFAFAYVTLAWTVLWGCFWFGRLKVKSFYLVGAVFFF